jgi:iron only hydrogenase large subunit-like protein
LEPAILDLSTLEEGKLDDATYFGRNFAKSGGLSAAVAEVLKEQHSSFEAKPVKCSGLSACKIALIQKKANTLPGNFIEGMACIGGCIGGPAALSHTLRDPAIMEAYAKQESSIHPSIEENIKKTGAPLDLPSTKK